MFVLCEVDVLRFHGVGTAFLAYALWQKATGPFKAEGGRRKEEVKSIFLIQLLNVELPGHSYNERIQ